MALYWDAHYIKNSSPAPISVQKRDNFKPIPGSSDATRVVPLDIKDPNINNLYHRTCIKQELGTLSAGDYTLTFDSTTKNGQLPILYLLYIFQVYIKNSDGTLTAMKAANYGFTGNQYAARVNQFLLKVRK